MIELIKQKFKLENEIESKFWSLVYNIQEKVDELDLHHKVWSYISPSAYLDDYTLHTEYVVFKLIGYHDPYCEDSMYEECVKIKGKWFDMKISDIVDELIEASNSQYEEEEVLKLHKLKLEAEMLGYTLKNIKE